MKIDRKVVARKNQWLVALPSELRRHLGLVPGARVWWHIGRKGQAALTVTGELRAGRPRREEECTACAKYRAEVERLRRELHDGEHGSAAGFFRQGYMQAVEQYGGITDRIDAHREMLRDLRAMVRELVKRGDAAASPPSGTPIPPRLAGVMVAAAREYAEQEEASPSDPSAPPAPARKSTRRRAAPHVQSPDPSLPSLPSEQGADSSGRQPQESHSDT
jgi:hypothetical protein